jgi:AraC-like DNA-binding protein
MAPDLTGSEAMAFPEARFVELTEALCPAPRSVRPNGIAVVQGETRGCTHCGRPWSTWWRIRSWIPRHERSANLLAETIAWMGHSSNQWEPERFPVNGARRSVAKRAQEFIEEHYWDSIRIEDLCRVTGVGVRTLQRCFREYFDLTISEYLKALRLDAARRELAAALSSWRMRISRALSVRLPKTRKP